jgi:hypothetical protein
MNKLIIGVFIALVSISSFAAPKNIESPVLNEIFSLLKPINTTLNPNGVEPYNIYSPLMYVTCSAKSSSSMFNCVKSEAVQLFDLLGGNSGWGTPITRDDIRGNYPQEFFNNEKFPKEAKRRLLNFYNVWEKKGHLPKKAVDLITETKNIEFAYFENAFTESNAASIGVKPSVERGIVIWDNEINEGLILSYDSSTSEFAQKL